MKSASLQALFKVQPMPRGTVPARRTDALVVECKRLCLERDELWLDRHPALAFCFSMIFSENRIPPRIKSGAGFFRIML
jgi:hypothetical protein